MAIKANVAVCMINNIITAALNAYKDTLDKDQLVLKINATAGNCKSYF